MTEEDRDEAGPTKAIDYETLSGWQACLPVKNVFALPPQTSVEFCSKIRLTEV